MVYDIVIIGSGPAGITSSIYAKRANLNVLVIEKAAFGGLITHSPKIENYPGYNSLSGLELADKFMDQAMNLGVMFEFDDYYEDLNCSECNKILIKNINMPPATLYVLCKRK
jgi:thioredoxin reductase